MDLTTKERVQALLASGGQKANPLDALIPVLIADVSIRFEKYIGRPTQTLERTETFDSGPTISRFFLGAFPIVSIASVEYDPDRVFGGTGDLIEPDGYALDSRRGFLILDGPTFWRYVPRAVQIVYTGGLGANPNEVVEVYSDLAHAADLQISHLVKQRHALGATSVSAGAGSTAFVGGYDLLPEVKTTLETYRRRVTE